MNIATIAIGALLVALAVDRWFGEPPQRWHPVVWMGKYLGGMGQRFAPRSGGVAVPALRPFVLGALAWCLGAIGVLAIALVVQALAGRLPAAGAVLLLGLSLKPLLAWRMLKDEVLAVEAALAVSLESGRTRLARLVSRDVDALTETEVRESAIESLAENLNDSVVAPLFWFALLGLPGAAVYRFANTADAMWGYRSTRDGRDWTWAGKWAARADDVLSWVPARLCAWLLLVSCRSARNGRGDIGALKREARQTPSPNSGWPMAAMALCLGVRLAKPDVYALNGMAREAVAHDTLQAARLGARVVAWMAIASSIVIGAVAFAVAAGRAAWATT